MPRKSMTQPSDPLAGLRLPPVYEWVDCELDDVNEALTRPLRVKLLINASRAEVLALSQAISELIDRAVDDTSADDRAAFDLIAPRIVAWNVEAENAEGERVDLPPPAEFGGAVIELLPMRAQTYLLRLVQLAHFGGDTRSKLSRRPAATASTEDAKTPSGPQIVNIPTGDQPQSRRKNS